MPSYIRNGNYRTGCGCSRCAALRNLNAAVVFDDANSILNPACDEKQRFCYQINGADSTGNAYVPLEYVIISIGNGINMDDFCSIQVAINGVFQQVEWGVNAQIICVDSPDCVTGCTGLKLMFPLNNATDMMHVCFTMQRVFTVGTVYACLNVHGTAVTGISIPGPVQPKECGNGAGYQRTGGNPCPCLTASDAVILPCGNPKITKNDQGDCGYIITQKFTVAIPVDIAADYTGDRITANIFSGNGCYHHRENCTGCEENGYQTRIQDLIRDPMIWHN